MSAEFRLLKLDTKTLVSVGLLTVGLVVLGGSVIYLETFNNPPLTLPLQNIDTNTKVEPFPWPQQPKHTATPFLAPEATRSKCKPVLSDELLISERTKSMLSLENGPLAGIVGDKIIKFDDIMYRGNKYQMIYPDKLKVESPLIRNDAETALQSAMTHLADSGDLMPYGERRGIVAVKLINELIPNLGFEKGSRYNEEVRAAARSAIENSINNLLRKNSDNQPVKGLVFTPGYRGNFHSSSRQILVALSEFAKTNTDWKIDPIREIASPTYSKNQWSVRDDWRSPNTQMFTMRHKSGIIIDVYTPYDINDLASLNFRQYSHVQTVTDQVFTATEIVNYTLAPFFAMMDKNTDYLSNCTRTFGISTGYSTKVGLETMWNSIDTNQEYLGGGVNIYVGSKIRTFDEIQIRDTEARNVWKIIMVANLLRGINAVATKDWGAFLLSREQRMDWFFRDLFPNPLPSSRSFLIDPHFGSLTK